MLYEVITNVEFLEEESIGEMDAFIAVTGDSETNIISCLVAKNRRPRGPAVRAYTRLPSRLRIIV